jgi:catechol 2,3-dioxygenase-like lactoylglutathione lyase family enzyme
MEQKTNMARVHEFRLKLYPQDFYAVRKFYEEVLGYPVTTEWDSGEQDKGVMFDVGGTTLELLSPKDGYKPAQGASVAWEVEDVMALWEEVKDKAHVAFEPRHNDWGDTSFRILDPEGFQITFFTKD